MERAPGLFALPGQCAYTREQCVRRIRGGSRRPGQRDVILVRMGPASLRVDYLTVAGTRYVPTDIAKQIYGQVSGASFDDDLGQWVVPCDAEVDIALQFG